ncbi:hypothetical protein D3C86_578170 [compost metagenome]
MSSITAMMAPISWEDWPRLEMTETTSDMARLIWVMPAMVDSTEVRPSWATAAECSATRLASSTFCATCWTEAAISSMLAEV